MPKISKLDRLYMGMAIDMASISYGVRGQVGAILVTNYGVILTGVNGLPQQLGNTLEDPVYDLVTQFGESPKYVYIGLETKKEVIHAELNCILKGAREGVSTVDATIYTTVSPCAQCASMLVSAGIKRVVFLSTYRDTRGLKILRDCGVIVEQIEGEIMKFSDFFNVIISLFDQDGVDFNNLPDDRQDEIKTNCRSLWQDGYEPQEAYDTLD